jgi:molybdate transport system ATP-binding protein
LLLLDEPLAALDAARKAEIFPYLEKLRDEVRLPMIYVTHSLDEVTRLADELVFVKDGRDRGAGSGLRSFARSRIREPAGAPSYGAVFEATVSAQTRRRLDRSRLRRRRLIVPRIAQPRRHALRVRLRAEDVMIARSVRGRSAPTTSWTRRSQSMRRR